MNEWAFKRCRSISFESDRVDGLMIQICQNCNPFNSGIMLFVVTKVIIEIIVILTTYLVILIMMRMRMITIRIATVIKEMRVKKRRRIDYQLTKSLTIVRTHYQ